jgi:2-oxoisovalerate ferredoxin oxidoreductase beta subunit
VLLLGEILAKIGLREQMSVSWLPSYGPEMRSGSAHCHVCLSSERIGSPMVDHPDVLVVMNEISLRKFAAQVTPGGVILYNRDALPEDFSAPPGVTVVCLPASDMADKLGATKAANMVMLGALTELTELLPLESTLATLEKAIRNKALLDVDRKAIEAGREFAAQEALVAGR